MVVAGVVRLHGTFRAGGDFHVAYGWSSTRPYVTATLGEATFGYDGGRVRVTDADGLLRVSDGERCVVRDRDGTLVSPGQIVLASGPEVMLAPRQRRLDTASPTTWQGRPAWDATGGRSRWVLDDETAIVLRHEELDEAGAVTGWAELDDLDFDRPCDAAMFDLPDAAPWIGPPHPGEERHASPAVWAGRRRPTVAWSPEGPPHHPVAGDPETGHLVQQVRLAVGREATFLLLHRRPVGGSQPLPRAGHRWSAAGWDWALDASGGATVEAVCLEAMAASVDVERIWPAP
jgi:hypothetical protein